MMTLRQKYTTVIALFVNYILQGMAAIIISQHLDKLVLQYNSTAKNLTLVISAIGLGRILVLYLSGYLSDRYGRKPVILMGMISYLIFFTGLILSRNIMTAMVSALFAGFANAFLDTGTYPAIAELFPEHVGGISVFNKAFISIGQFVLPYLVGYLMIHNYYFGYAFILCIAIVTINIIVVSRCKFPKPNQESVTQTLDETTRFKEAPKMHLEGLALFTLGFTIVTLFNIIVWWMPEFGVQIAHMEREAALKLVSIYSLGSFISVFITAFIARQKSRNTDILLVCSIATVLILAMVLIHPSALICQLGAFGIGVFTAGGIWQLGLAIMLELFPDRKGHVTSIYTLATSVSVMISPYITGLIAEWSIYYVFVFNLIIALISLVCACIVFTRYKLIRK